MGFPTDQQLELTAEAAWGADLTAAPTTWTWTDLGTDTAAMLTRLIAQTITIQRGCTVGGITSQQTTATIQALNTDGYLTPKLATSPWWPNVDVGTPIRLSIRDRANLVATFTAPAVINGWPDADTGETWTPGTASVASSTGTQGRVTVPSVNTSHNIRSTRTERDTDILFDTSVAAVALGQPIPVGVVVRPSGTGTYRLYCHLNYGLLGQLGLQVSRYYGSPSTFTALSAVTSAVTYSAGTLIRCRVQVFGPQVRMRAWLASGTEPGTWDIDITQTSSIVTGWNAALSATDRIAVRVNVPAGNTNILPVVVTVDTITIAQMPSARVEGYITDVRPTFEPLAGGLTWSTATIDIGGVGSRLERADAPPLGPLRRSVEKSDPPPIAYWPCEDAEGSTIAVSAFPGFEPMLVTGPAVFAFAGDVPEILYQSRFGSKPMISLAAGAKLSGVVPPTTVQDQWVVSLVAEYYAADILPAITELRVAEWTTTGTHNRWALVALAAGGHKIRAYSDSLGTTVDVVTDPTVFVSGQLTYSIQAVQNGANIDCQILYNDNGYATGSVAGILAQPTRIVINPDRVNVTSSVTPAGLRMIVGHIRVVDDYLIADLPNYYDAEQGLAPWSGTAWFHESAHGRAGRLSTEERVPFTLVGDPASTGMTILNAQQDGTFGTLMEAAVDSESGALLYEHAFGYAMLDRTARYNQPVALTVDMATYNYSDGTDPADVLVPQLDARLPNVITVQRANGATGSYAADEAYRKRRGTISQGYTLDVLSDDDPRQHATWRVHTNVDAKDALYPSLQVDLAANPTLIDSWLSCDIGSRVQRTNQPVIAGYGTIDQVVLAITETIGPDTWLAVCDAAPAQVWDVGTWDAATSLWQPTTSALAAGITTTALSMSVDGHGEPWTTGAVSLLIQVGAEHLAVSNISGAGPYTFTISARSINGVVQAHLTDDLITFVDPTVWAL